MTQVWSCGGGTQSAAIAALIRATRQPAFGQPPGILRGKRKRGEAMKTDVTDYARLREIEDHVEWLKLRYGKSAKSVEYLRFLLSLVREQRWVRVEDRLPEREVNVLCFCDDRVQRDGHYQPGCSCSTPWHGGALHHAVTHWRPLPAPPEEEEQRGDS